MPDHNHGLNRYRRRFIQAGVILSGGMLIGACGRDNPPVPAEPRDDTPDPQARDDKPESDDAGTASKLTYGALLCGGNQVNAETGEKRFVFTQLSIDQAVRDRGAQQKLITDIGFLAHGVIKNPLADHKVLVFEKKGPGAAEIDLKDNAITRRIKPAGGHAFYGHGAYSADGKLVYATEYDEMTYAGAMTVRDAESFEIIDDFPTYGERPHDCQFIDDGRVVAITNGGGALKGGAKPNVTYVEVGTGKLIEKIEFDNPLINSGHLMISPGGDLAVAHAMREGLHNRKALGAISLRPDRGDFKTMVSPARITGAMRGETLSLCMLESNKLVAATNPYAEDGGLVTFWNYETQEFVDSLPVEQPRGVGLTLDESYWVVTFGEDSPGVILVSTETNRPDDKPIVFEAASQGSHAYIHGWYQEA